MENFPFLKNTNLFGNLALMVSSPPFWKSPSWMPFCLNSLLFSSPSASGVFNSGCSLGKKIEHPVLTTGFSCLQHRQTLKKASCAQNSGCCFSGFVSWPDKNYGLSLLPLPDCLRSVLFFFLDVGSSSVSSKQELSLVTAAQGRI